MDMIIPIPQCTVTLTPFIPVFYFLKWFLAMFVAHGPFSSVVKTLHHQNARSWLTRPNKGWHSTADDIYVMESFQNVNIYNLVMKLLGAEEYAAPTNGTTGFWDKYF